MQIDLSGLPCVQLVKIMSQARAINCRSLLHQMVGCAAPRNVTKVAHASVLAPGTLPRHRTAATYTCTLSNATSWDHRSVPDMPVGYR
jgi:hypothetical protein